MLSPETLKPFILHEDQFVGSRIARYFYEGWMLDKDIIPLLLQARQKHGWSAYCSPLVHGEYQPIDEATFETVVEEIKRTPLAQEKFGLGHLIRWAPLEYVDKFMKSADASAIDFHSAIDYFVHRLEIAQWSDERLWQALQDICREMDEHPDKPERNHVFLSCAVETLALRPTPDNAEFCRLLEDKAIENKWLELYLIDLAGARKLRAAIPSLLRRLSVDDDDLMPMNCAKALVRIADPEAIRTLQKTFIQRDNTYWPFALEVFERFRHPETEPIILELLDDARLDRESCDWLIYALCAQLSPHAIERYENQWKGVAEEIHGDLHREVLVAAVVNGIQLPYASEFRKETLAEEKRRAWWKSPAENDSIDDEEEQKEEEAWDQADDEEEEAGDQADDEEGEAWDRAYAYAEEESGNVWLGRDEEEQKNYYGDEPYRRPEPKVGRNDPCPCGSGKKYKKCCGKT
ncbi:MAG: SEC-C metal-binding domain-containing protein [Candidatus Sumerlaeota bacterium]|nr:SEC-C metal-binding domain-containing protein [Candidatus Sumerlaeota bacterium]